MAKENKTKEIVITPTHKYIVEVLKNNGFDKFINGIQLFINQFEEDYSISINYMSTGIKINKKQINTNELVDDDLIKICRTYECIL